VIPLLESAPENHEYQDGEAFYSVLLGGETVRSGRMVSTFRLQMYALCSSEAIHQTGRCQRKDHSDKHAYSDSMAVEVLISSRHKDVWESGGVDPRSLSRGTWWGFICARGKRFFSSQHRPNRQWVPSSYSLGKGAVTSTLKRPGRWADHSQCIITLRNTAWMGLDPLIQKSERPKTTL
jgi:hypothetical protein